MPRSPARLVSPCGPSTSNWRATRSRAIRRRSSTSSGSRSARSSSNASNRDSRSRIDSSGCRMCRSAPGDCSARSRDCSSTVESDPAVAGVAQGVQRECDQACRDDAEKPRAVLVMEELRERAVEADGGLWVVVDRGLDQEDADESEDDRSREMAHRPDGGDPPPQRWSHLLDLGVVEELLREAAVALVKRDPDHDRSRRADEPLTAGPAEHAAGLLLCVAGVATTARAEQDLDGERADDRVGDSACSCGEAIEATVGFLRSVSERSAEKPPERVTAEPDRDEREQYLPEWLPRDRVQSALLVCELAPLAEGKLEREDADDSPDEAPGDEAGTREDLERPRADEALARRLGTAESPRGAAARCESS